MKKNTIFILTMIMVLLLSTSSIIERDQQITLEENISNTTINEQIATASASAVWATTNKATNIVSAPYYDEAPGDNGGENESQIDKINQFTQKISEGTSLVNSWRDANNGTLGFGGAATWAATYHEEAEGDTIFTYNRGVESLASPTIYYICLRKLKKELNTSSVNALNNFNLNTENITEQSFKQEEWSETDGIREYKKTGYDIVKSNPVSISEDTAVKKVAAFVKSNGILLDADSSIECGRITRSKLSDDGSCFTDKEILAYTFTVCSTDTKGNRCADMYFEVNDSGVTAFSSAE